MRTLEAFRSRAPAVVTLEDFRKLTVQNAGGAAASSHVAVNAALSLTDVLTLRLCVSETELGATSQSTRVSASASTSSTEIESRTSTGVNGPLLWSVSSRENGVDTEGAASS